MDSGGTSRAAGSSRGAASGSQRRGAGGAEGSGSQIPTLTTIDDVVGLVKAAQTSEGERKVLLPALAKLCRSAKGQGDRVLLEALQGNIDPLSMLDPAADTLGYIYILATRAVHAQDITVAQTLLPAFQHLTQNLDPSQLQGAGDIATVFMRGIKHIADVIDDQIWAIPFMLRTFDAFCRVHGSASNLTTLHTVLVYQCLRTAHYDVAYEWVIQHDVVSADVNVSPLAYTDVLEYFYYAGLICIKLGNLEAASSLFEQCVCTPAQVVSAIQLDAYKKLILVQLLKDGSTSPLPKYVSQAVQRAVRDTLSSIAPYTALARAVEADINLTSFIRNTNGLRQESMGVMQRLQQRIVDDQQQYVEDQNLGLVKRIGATFIRRRIERLGAVFTNLSLSAIVDLLGLDQHTGPILVAGELCQLDLDGKTAVTLTVHAVGSQPMRASAMTVDQLDTMQPDDGVAFDVVRTEHEGLPGAQRLVATMKENKHWQQLVESKERSVALSEAYLGKIYTSRERFIGMALDDDDDDVAFA